MSAADPSSQSPVFDDPPLKQVLKRTLGKEVAPAALRSRIAAALDEIDTGAADAPEPARRLMLFRSPLMGLALAAMVVIVASVAIRFATAPSTAGKKLVAILPQQIAAAM